MTVKDLQTLYDYDNWANKKLLQVMSQLTPEQFTRNLGGSYGSIRNTFVHMISAEWGWLGRCGGGRPRGPRLNPENFPTLESVLETSRQIDGWVREYLSGLKDEDVSRMAEYPNDKGEKRSMPVGELMQHAANHNVHHRGQIALLLRLLGYTPGDFDVLFYYAEKRGVPAF